MRNWAGATLLLAVMLAAMSLVLAACGGPGDDGPGSSKRRDAAARTATDGPTPQRKPKTPGPSPGPAPGPDGTLPVVILSPRPFTNVVRRTGVKLEGTAKVPRAALAWAILGADLKPLAQGTMRASCAAPCLGHYRMHLTTARIPVGSWELHVWQPGASADGARLHDTLVPITIVEHATPGAPPPDALPPGGAPQ